MSGSLEGPIAKLNRAIEHYLTLKNEFHWGADYKARPVTAKRQRDGSEYIVRVGKIESLAPQWPVLYGEALYNLRSTLDLLVYQLHVRHYRGVIPEAVAGRSAFRIRKKVARESGSGAILPTSSWPEIGHLGSRERARIEWLQPYKGWYSKQYPPREGKFYVLVVLCLHVLGELLVPDRLEFGLEGVLPPMKDGMGQTAGSNVRAQSRFRTPPPQSRLQLPPV